MDDAIMIIICLDLDLTDANKDPDRTHQATHYGRRFSTSNLP